MEEDGSADGRRERGSGSRDGRSAGKGGRKEGMCGGGLQLSVRGRFRVGDVGLDTGDNGKGGVDGGRGGGGVSCRPPTSCDMGGTWISLLLSSPATVASIISTSSSFSSSSPPSSSSPVSPEKNSGTGAQTKGIDSRSTGSPFASDAERERQTRQYKRCNHHHVPRLTLELVQILLSFRTVAGIARQLVAFRSAVLVELVHANAEFVEGTHGVPDGDVQPSRMLSVLRACCGQQDEIAREEIREREGSLGG